MIDCSYNTIFHSNAIFQIYNSSCNSKIVHIAHTAQKNEVFHLVTFTEEILHGKLHFLCSVKFENVAVVLCDSIVLSE